MTIRLPLVLCLGLAAAGATAADLAAPETGPHAGRRAELEARFAAADADRDGRLDRVEAATVGDRLVGFFDRLDADTDGKLTREELASAARGYHGHRGHAGFAFFAGVVKGMDDDGDGDLSLAEIGTKMPAWSDAFATIDANADGRLQRDELHAHARAQHGHDADGHDGEHDGHHHDHRADFGGGDRDADPDRG